MFPEGDVEKKKGLLQPRPWRGLNSYWGEDLRGSSRGRGPREQKDLRRRRRKDQKRWQKDRRRSPEVEKPAVKEQATVENERGGGAGAESARVAAAEATARAVQRRDLRGCLAVYSGGR